MEQKILTEEELDRIDKITDERLRHRIDLEIEHINRRYKRLRALLKKENGKRRHNIV